MRLADESNSGINNIKKITENNISRNLETDFTRDDNGNLSDIYPENSYVSISDIKYEYN